MYRTFLRDVIAKTHMSRNYIAADIGIAIQELDEAMRDMPVRQETAAAISNWLNIPSTEMFTSEKDPMVAGVSICEHKVPDLIIVLRTAANEVFKQTMTEEEFRDILKYALGKIDGPDRAK